MTRPRQTGHGLAHRLPGADGRIFQFFAAWQAARGDRLVPRKVDLDPMRVAPLLGETWMYRLDPAEDDFVRVLADETVNEAWGRSIKGLRLRDVVGPQDHPVILGRWQQIQSVPHVHYGASEERLSALDVRSAERLLLPLADDSDEPRFVLGLSLYRIAMADPDRGPLIPEDITQIPCRDL